MKRTSWAVITLALALPVLCLTGPASASPATSKAPAAPAATGHAAPSPKMPDVSPAALTGYVQVFSGLLTDPAGGQVLGTAKCPAGHRLVGGGAVISSFNLGENLNGSFPSTDGKTWDAYVNNATGSDGTFQVYADCVQRVLNYSVVVGTGVDNPNGSQTTATATCPTGTVPFGGGGVGSSTSTAVNLNTSIPQTHGWRVDVNNASGGGDTATAVVACGKKPLGFSRPVGTASDNPSGAQSSASVSCPAGRVVFGGGGFSSTGSTVVDLNSSAPSGSSSWIVYEDNNSGSDASITAYAICGKAS